MSKERFSESSMFPNEGNAKPRTSDGESLEKTQETKGSMSLSSETFRNIISEAVSVTLGGEEVIADDDPALFPDTLPPNTVVGKVIISFKILEERNLRTSSVVQVYNEASGTTTSPEDGGHILGKLSFSVADLSPGASSTLSGVLPSVGFVATFSDQGNIYYITKRRQTSDDPDNQVNADAVAMIHEWGVPIIPGKTSESMKTQRGILNENQGQKFLHAMRKMHREQ